MEKRYNYIDMAKGFAVLLVIFGHTFREQMRADFAWCDLSYLFVYKFHVSLLFMLSGMGYAITVRKNTALPASTYIAKKAKSQLLPWFSYSVLIYAVFCVMQFVPQCRQIFEGSAYSIIPLHKFLFLLLCNNNKYAFHVWYLQTLFLFTLSAFLLDKYIKEDKAFLVKVILIVCAPAFYRLFCGGWVWLFKAYFQKLLFFLVGTIISKEFIRKNAKWLSIAGLVSGIAVFGLVYFPLDNIYAHEVYGMILSYVDNAFVLMLCIGITAAFSLIDEKAAGFAAFGRNTMPYYLYHQPFCCAFLGIVLYEKMHISALATAAACMAAGIIIPYIVLKLINMAKLDNIMKKIGLPV